MTKNAVDPNVDRDVWGLEIGGHVEHGKSYGFADLQQFAQVDLETTLMCIRNRIGAGLFSNANWRGVRLRDVLAASGLKAGAISTGHSCTTRRRLAPALAAVPVTVVTGTAGTRPRPSPLDDAGGVHAVSSPGLPSSTADR